MVGAREASYNSLGISGSIYGVYGKNISWSASYDLNTLAAIVVPGADCSLPWGGTIAHGANTTAYLADPGTPSCTSETRTCTNGTLSGSYTYASCTPGGGVDDDDCGTPGGTPITGITYSATSYYGGYTCYQDETKMRDGECDSSDTVVGTNSGANEGVYADFGSDTYITTMHLAPIPNSFGSWGAAYLNNRIAQCFNGGVWYDIVNPIGGVSDGTTTDFAVGMTCSMIFVYTNDYVGIGDFWFE